MSYLGIDAKNVAHGRHRGPVDVPTPDIVVLLVPPPPATSLETSYDRLSIQVGTIAYCCGL